MKTKKKLLLLIGICILVLFSIVPRINADLVKDCPQYVNGTNGEPGTPPLGSPVIHTYYAYCSGLEQECMGKPMEYLCTVWVPYQQ